MKLDNYLIYNRLIGGSRVQEEDRKFRCMNLEKDPNGIGVHGFKARPGATRGMIPNLCLSKLRLYFPMYNADDRSGPGVQGFKVAFPSLDCIWEAYLREKRQLRQAQSKIWSQIGNYLGK
jgi:hypothetical protein